ncbi:2-deoxy-scyllo-inosose synthase [Paenibacillaceae bacterium WGS1546]|uniref:2-deoxy-scyllo-inosose synthase n=1 Tax=Cohnella sp. WGS1546 TaxID=3366810 RepID=UPI00372D5E18
MFRTTIRFGDYSYPFLSGTGALEEAAERLKELDARQYLIITDRGTPVSIAGRALNAFERTGPAELMFFQPGESEKTLQTVHDLAQRAIALGADRRTAVVALGGGVSGNIAGMVAGLLFRGLPLIHVPTTLMAASDSVLSLKQAVNLKQGKNLVGMYYAPKLVCVEPDFLATLPAREVRSGLCELVKNLLAIRPDKIDEFRSLLRPSNRYEPDEYQRFIEFCIEAKMSVMADDPYERKEGLVLEYGHTLGHALELVCGGKYSHGECVAFGMLCAAYIARRMGLLSAGEEALHHELLQRIGVKVEPEPGWLEQIESYVRHDNKKGYRRAMPDRTGFVLLNGLGRTNREADSYITMVEDSLASEALQAIRQGLVTANES